VSGKRQEREWKEKPNRAREQAANWWWGKSSNKGDIFIFAHKFFVKNEEIRR